MVLSSRSEQRTYWFTEPPQTGLFLELISFSLLHPPISSVPNHLEWTSPLTYCQARLHGGSFCQGLGELLRAITSCEASSVVTITLLHSAKGSGLERWLQSLIFLSHRFSRWSQTYSPWCLSAPRLQLEELTRHGSPFAIHELALTAPLQSLKTC